MTGPSASLPADLETLISHVGGTLVDAIPVSPLQSPRLDRQCFRLRFADGRVLKGRYVDTIEKADRLDALTGRLDPRSFPPLLVRHHRAFLTDWIDGTSLDPRQCTPAMLRLCGAMHAAVHRIAIEARPEWRRRHGEWQTRLASGLRLLVDSRLLDTAEARHAEALAAAAAPGRAMLGLCHGDFCAENIIIDRKGRVVVVDNDSVAVDEYGYDLARTWHRWPMTEAQSRAYMAGYGPAGHLAAVEAHFVHWAVVVPVDAAAFRLRTGLDGAEAGVGRLRAVLQDPDGCARFLRHDR